MSVKNFFANFNPPTTQISQSLSHQPPYQTPHLFPPLQNNHYPYMYPHNAFQSTSAFPQVATSPQIHAYNYYYSNKSIPNSEFRDCNIQIHFIYFTSFHNCISTITINTNLLLIQNPSFLLCFFVLHITRHHFYLENTENSLLQYVCFHQKTDIYYQYCL